VEEGIFDEHPCQMLQEDEPDAEILDNSMPIGSDRGSFRLPHLEFLRAGGKRAVPIESRTVNQLKSW
jgi:hypothetical protein